MNFPIIYTMDVEPLDNNVAYQMIVMEKAANEEVQPGTGNENEMMIYSTLFGESSKETCKRC